VTIRAVLFDLDDVVRHFDPYDDVESAYGLPPGTLGATVFAADLLEPTVTGAWTYEQWIEAIGDRLAGQFGEAARPAATAFSTVPATVDAEVLELVAGLRGRYTVALLTNGTTRVEEELRTLRIDDRFDHVFNSARIGYAKPDRRVFEHAVGVLGYRPHECVFTDDSALKLAGAHEIGMHAVHFTGVETLVAELQRLGVTTS
jgi:putative hydrolase of the HAD superfamily